LRWRYGDQLSWRLRLIGLAESAAVYEKRGYTTERIALGYIRFRNDYGMPFNLAPRPRLSGTGYPCRAVVATRLVAPEHELAVLRALQFIRFTTLELFDTEEGVRAALARVPDIDADQVIAAIGDDATEAAYQADRSAVRTAAGKPTEFQGKAANTDGAVRYTAPSLIFTHRNGTSLEAGGFQPIEAYDVAIANLDTTLDRRAAAEDVVEAIAVVGYSLTTAEVAAVMAPHLTKPDSDAAERALVVAVAEGKLRAEPIGGSTLWHLA
jgi:2-hydroxychromene-2-carboxylate isomerase